MTDKEQVCKQKIVFGLEFHAVTFTIQDENQHGLNAPLNQTYSRGGFSEDTCQFGRLSYSEVFIDRVRLNNQT